MSRMSGMILCAGTILLLVTCGGCAAMRPLEGIPVCELPIEYRMPMRSGKQMIDLSLLRRTPPREHRVDAGDTLGVYIDGVLGGRQQSPPVNFPQNPNSHSSVGYPVRVRSDGTVSLPLTEPISVRGLTIAEVEQKIRHAYTRSRKPILKAGSDRIFVTLQRPRHHRILVIREEAGNPGDVTGRPGRTTLISSNGKRGMGRIVRLPAYRNDVLHALAETGGLPGLDAHNVIYVIRRRRGSEENIPAGPPTPTSTDTGTKTSTEAQPIRNLPTPQGTARPLSYTKTDVSRKGLARLSHHVRMPTSSASYEDRGHVDFERFGGFSTVSLTPAEVGSTSTSKGGPHDSHPGHVRRETGPALSPQNASRAAEKRQKRREHAAVPAPFSQHSLSGQPRSLVSQRLAAASAEGAEIIHIPLRLHPGEPLPFSRDDIVLQDGDVVLVESRDTDVFFTAGLLGGGRFQLPRDHDLDVLQALAMVQSSQNRNLPTRSMGGVAATNQDVTVGASELIVLRPMPDGSQLPIRVDLYEAMRNPAERVYVRPGDILVLQYAGCERWGAIFERHILDGLILGISSGLFFNN